MIDQELLENLPRNLSRQATKDLLLILRRSAEEFGITTARRSCDRILGKCKVIEAGHAVGHKRPDIRTLTPTLVVNESPWVIFFNPETRQITRIIHGARDFPALFR